MTKRERISYAFLMEMMWVCVFFLICSCIFVMAFVKAESMSQKADTLSKAVQAASNAMEESFSLGEAADPAGFSNASFDVSIDANEADGLLSVSVLVTDKTTHEEIFLLEGARATGFFNAGADISSSAAGKDGN